MALAAARPRTGEALVRQDWALVAWRHAASDAMARMGRLCRRSRPILIDRGSVLDAGPEVRIIGLERVPASGRGRGDQQGGRRLHHLPYAERDRVHYLNDTAVLLLEFCAGQVTAAKLPGLLQAAYDLPEEPRGLDQSRVSAGRPSRNHEVPGRLAVRRTGWR